MANGMHRLAFWIRQKRSPCAARQPIAVVGAAVSFGTGARYETTDRGA